MADLFPTLPDDARLWVYAAHRSLLPDEEAQIRDAMQQFCAQWTSHRRPVHGQAEILHNRFVLIAATIDQADISGCGIDKSVHMLNELGERLGIQWLSSLDILFRDGAQVEAVSRARFRELAREGRVTGRTTVFDLGITSLGDLRSGRFEQPAADTWHGRVFRLAEPAA